MSDFVPLPLVESSLPHPRPFWVESLNVPLVERSICMEERNGGYPNPVMKAL